MPRPPWIPAPMSVRKDRGVRRVAGYSSGCSTMLDQTLASTTLAIVNSWVTKPCDTRRFKYGCASSYISLLETKHSLMSSTSITEKRSVLQRKDEWWCGVTGKWFQRACTRIVRWWSQPLDHTLHERSQYLRSHYADQFWRHWSRQHSLQKQRAWEHPRVDVPVDDVRRCFACVIWMEQDCRCCDQWSQLSRWSKPCSQSLHCWRAHQSGTSEVSRTGLMSSVRWVSTHPRKLGIVPKIVFRTCLMLNKKSFRLSIECFITILFFYSDCSSSSSYSSSSTTSSSSSSANAYFGRALPGYTFAWRGCQVTPCYKPHACELNNKTRLGTLCNYFGRHLFCSNQRQWLWTYHRNKETWTSWLEHSHLSWVPQALACRALQWHPHSSSCQTTSQSSQLLTFEYAHQGHLRIAWNHSFYQTHKGYIQVILWWGIFVILLLWPNGHLPLGTWIINFCPSEESQIIAHLGVCLGLAEVI